MELFPNLYYTEYSHKAQYIITGDNDNFTRWSTFRFMF